MENIHLTNKRLHSETLLEGVSLVFPRFPLSIFFQLSGGSTSPHHFTPKHGVSTALQWRRVTERIKPILTHISKPVSLPSQTPFLQTLQEFTNV
jgi:hypothetical protein